MSTMTANMFADRSTGSDGEDILIRRYDGVMQANQESSGRPVSLEHMQKRPSLP